MLNSWLDRLLVLLALTTLVLTLFAFQYMWQGPPLPAVQSPPQAGPSPDPGFSFAQAGSNALDAGDPVAAVRLLERAVGASPLNPDWRRRLAAAYALQGDTLRSAEEGMRALDLELEKSLEEAPEATGD